MLPYKSIKTQPKPHCQKGFTLIELLVVIAVLGVLAAGVFTAINPLERLAQARDAQRKTNISQLAHALQTYYVTHATSSSPFPPTSPFPVGYSWITTLVTDGDLKSVIPQISNNPSTNCNGGVYSENGYCYYINGNDAYTMTQLESQKEKDKCSGGTYPYYLWDSGRGKIGVVCVNLNNWCLVGGCTFLP